MEIKIELQIFIPLFYIYLVSNISRPTSAIFTVSLAGIKVYKKFWEELIVYFPLTPPTVPLLLRVYSLPL
jgi:hypothetical protein